VLCLLHIRLVTTLNLVLSWERSSNRSWQSVNIAWTVSPPPIPDSMLSSKSREERYSGLHPCNVHWVSNPVFIDKWQILLYIIFLTFYFWNFRTSIIGVIIDSVKHILTTRLKIQHVIKFLYLCELPPTNPIGLTNSGLETPEKDEWSS
jgi:hypothetical protein